MGLNPKLNLKTGWLLDPEAPEYNLIALLSGEWPKIRRWSWNVGHFVGVSGFIKVLDQNEIFYIIRDTHKSFGIGGYHIQPMELVRKALIREDGREGGVLLIADKKYYDDIVSTVESIGLKVSIWDNGSPF